MQIRNSSNLKGIDISSNNNVTDFIRVKNAGIQIVYIKATEGISYLNPLLSDNYNKAIAAGLKVGFYHFFRAHNNDTENAKQQAQFFYNSIKSYHPDCRLSLDIETTEGIASKDMISLLAKTFLDTLMSISSKNVVLYTYSNFAQTNLTGILSCYSLWIAEYGANPPSNNPVWNNWIGFQYDNKGNIDGISNVVDLNEFNNNILLSIPVTQPQPTPQAPKPIPAPVVSVNPTISTSNKVKITGNNYATGQSIPLFAKLRTYDVLQVNPDKILIGIGKTVTGWIWRTDCKIVK